jgi:hypothetical protein
MESVCLTPRQHLSALLCCPLFILVLEAGLFLPLEKYQTKKSCATLLERLHVYYLHIRVPIKRIF